MLFAATIKELQHDSLPFMTGVLRQIALLIVTQQGGKYSKPPQTRSVFFEIHYKQQMPTEGMVVSLSLTSFPTGLIILPTTPRG